MKKRSSISKPANAKVKNTEARSYDHRRTLSYAPFGYQSLDENGNILDVNKYYLDLLGYEREEVIEKSFANFLTKEHAELFKTTFPESIRNKEVVAGLRLELVTKNGEKRIAEFTSDIERNENDSFIRTHCIFQDLTDIISKAETLERNQSHFNQAQKVGNSILNQIVYGDRNTLS